MNLDSDIASLVATGQDLIEEFRSKKNEINLALNNAVSVAPNLHRDFYVDSISGDNDINLGTVESPFATIKKAIDSVPKHGSATIRLSLNKTYIIDDDIDCGTKKIYLTTVSVPPTNSDRPVIQFKHYLGGGFNNYYAFRGFLHSYTLQFNFINLAVDDTGYDNTLPNSNALTILQSTGSSTGSVYYLNQCDVDLGSNGCPLLVCNNAVAILTLFLCDFSSTSGSILFTGSSGIGFLSVNTSTKNAGATWYDNVGQVVSNV